MQRTGPRQPTSARVPGTLPSERVSRYAIPHPRRPPSMPASARTSELPPMTASRPRLRSAVEFQHQQTAPPIVVAHLDESSQSRRRLRRPPTNRRPIPTRCPGSARMRGNQAACRQAPRGQQRQQRQGQSETIPAASCAKRPKCIRKRPRRSSQSSARNRAGILAPTSCLSRS